MNRKKLEDCEFRLEKAEAEVERLKTDLIWWALHASSVHRCDHNIEGGGRESESLSARKVTPKTDDAPTAPCPNCGAELTWFKHAWARKERDER